MASAAQIEVETEEGAKPKGGGKGLLFGLVAMLVLGGAGFYATWSGMVALPIGGAAKHEAAARPKPKDLPPVAFVPIDEIVISLGPRAKARHLVFAAQLEVEPGYDDEVKLLMPRILDVLNTYLRAVEERDLEEPSALPKLRAQMLRRIAMVTGEGRVRDLLITRFLLK
ncbi:flagellar basal body-associated FliL family protein [Oceanicella actignis]|uniref:Flagellar protein FliL n=1 Tax=Oceanicella actignis TaxID=1189325 RepID=A0A1M7T693_9RHOB|nr:flagellar basal body-associated FliL family protein [Oceanicella actignis]SET44535.1 flagellar FliL protein [Oceanicella actignis]SHN66260.1 flagellar FliL protein [Oceanicella actignis]